MRYKKLGHTDMNVSELCLGTMTWGSQNTEAEGHAQMDYALAHGVNFWDTAEAYPVNPMSAETCGDTERIIGTWMKANPGKRDKIVLASKVAGPGRPHIRGGAPMTPETIKLAIEGSLQRLNTDYVDLYQLHWPNRGSYHFGQSWNYAPAFDTAKVRDDLLEILRAVDGLVREGKVRALGLSNETAWGVSQFVQLAKEHNLPRVVSTQNEYSLMYRLHDLDLQEVSMAEGVGLLPYSPLAVGWLTGKYYHGARPADARLSQPHYASSQRQTPQAQKAADAYVDLARGHGLEPAQMALAWTLTRPFVTSTIMGASSVAQLAMNIGSADVKLSEAVMKEIAALHRDHPMPF